MPCASPAPHLAPHSNSATAPADALEHVLSTNPAAVLPATMWGDVTIGKAVADWGCWRGGR